MYDDLLDVLNNIGLALTAEEIADILWLAARLPAAEVATEAPGERNPPPTGERNPLPPGPDGARSASSESRSATSPSRSERGSIIQQEPAMVNLYPALARSAPQEDDAIGVRPFRSPAAHAMPGALEIGRSLRPLKRRVPSRVRYVLDEMATAEHIADTTDPISGIADWRPILRPAPERWLSAVLLMDESPGMAIWQRTVYEFATLLERLGAFRTLGLWGFRPDATGSGIELYAGAGPAADRSRPRRPGELIEHVGDQLILVVSDCVTSPWRNGSMANLLTQWGRKSLVAIVQVLPQQLWPRTGLGNYPILHLRTPNPGTPNHLLDKRWLFATPLDDEEDKEEEASVPIPVMPLDPAWLNLWARSLAGNSGLWVPAYNFYTEDGPVEGTTTSSRAQPLPNSERLVEIFNETASPTARELAAYFAAVPLTLPIMRLVQAATMPQSRQTHLAEVFLSGLIRRVREPKVAGESGEPNFYESLDKIEYDFVGDARDRLLNPARAGKIVDVLRVVSAHVNERAGQALDFGALIADPDAASADGLSLEKPEHREFARIAASALRRFGGSYRRLANRLDASLGEKRVTATREAKSDVTSTVDQTVRPATRPAQTFMLLVGINEYHLSGVGDLKGCVNDVNGIRQFFETSIAVDPANVTLLTDGSATQRALLDGWDAAAERLQSGDHFLFMFSGNADSVDNQTLLITVDAEREQMVGLTSQEMIRRISALDQRGVSVVCWLDTSHAGSFDFVEQTWQQSAILGSARARDEATDANPDVGDYGLATYHLLEALRRSGPDTTWGDLFDYVYFQVASDESHQAGWRQTPQIIGRAGISLRAGEPLRQPPSYFLVGPDPRDTTRLRAAAHRATGLKAGGRIAIWPPGSDLSGPPLAYGYGFEWADNDEAWTYFTTNPDPTIEPASRAVIESYESNPALRVQISDLTESVSFNSPLLIFNSPEETDVWVSLDEKRFSVTDAAGAPLLGGRLGYQGFEARMEYVGGILEHFARYRHFATLQNLEIAGPLRNSVSLRVETRSSTSELRAGSDATLFISSSADIDCFVSLWATSERLGIRRIYPPQSDCQLLRSGSEIRVSYLPALTSASSTGERILFKLFATEEPTNLDILALPDLDDAVEVYRVEEPTQPSTRPNLAPYRTILWRPGQTISLRFLDGEPEQQERVKAISMAWTEYANLIFNFSDDPDAAVRISFDLASGNWSYVGTQCLAIGQPEQATMNLGALTADLPEEEFRQIVLYHFGLMLGLSPEHQNPAASIPWDREKVSEYFSQFGWSEKEIQENVYPVRQRDDTLYKEFDPLSVMLMPFPNELTMDNYAFSRNSELSASDKEWVALLYPLVAERW